jgi:hypothetical protein
MPTELLNMLPPEWRPGVTFLIAVVLLVFSVLRSFDSIETGDLGIRTSLGKIKLEYRTDLYGPEEIRRQREIDAPLVAKGRPAQYGRPKDRQPGLRWQLMFYHRYIKITAQSQPYQIDDITVMSKDEYNGWVLPQIVLHAFGDDIYLIHLASKDAPAALRAEVNTKLAAIMADIGYDRIGRLSDEDRQAISSLLQAATAERFKELGYEFEMLDLGMAQPKTELATGRAIREVGLAGAISSITGDKPTLSWNEAAKAS